MLSAETASITGTAVVGVWVAWSDVARMTIPNRAVLALVLIFFLVGGSALSWPQYWPRVASIFVVLGVGFALFAAGVIGAGDAKYASVMAPFIAASDAANFLFLTVAVLFVAFLTHRVSARLSIQNYFPKWESWNSENFPLGLALGPSLPLWLLLSWSSS
jgi:prepilin peptidase CpaA